MKSAFWIFLRLNVVVVSLWDSEIPLADDRFDACFKLANDKSEARFILSEDELNKWVRIFYFRFYYAYKSP